MHCIYHPLNPAHVGCSSCGRGLCPACDHRIKGSPYCQDCIVAGIDMLRRNRQQARTGRTPQRSKSANAATLLALVPGLGAAYNGQNIKALLHFSVTAGLWHLADIFEQPFAPLFLLGGVAFYLYTIYDARQSAERQREGEDLRTEDDQLKYSLRRRAPVWGGLLVGVGVLSFLHLFFDAQMYGLWPLLLIAAGVYLLRGFQRFSRPETAASSYQTPPPSVIVTPYDRGAAAAAAAAAAASGEHPGYEARRFDQGR